MGGGGGGGGPAVEAPRGRGREPEPEPGGAGKELLERRGGRRGTRGGDVKAAWHRRPLQRDGQPRRAIAPAHTHAHSHTRSHPRHRAIAGSQAPFAALPRRVLTVAICVRGNFLQASSSRRPLQQPPAPRTLRPGFALAAPPLPPRLSSSLSSPHSPLVSGARPGTSQRERGAGVCMHRPPSSCSAHCTW